MSFEKVTSTFVLLTISIAVYCAD